MDSCLPVENGKIVGGRKYPDALKDAKKKLSVINKRIDELHHQRKFTYKNSVKVKKMIHLQINQIFNCLRARERSLWCDVDEAFLSQDASISEELSKLQSVHAHCKVLLNNIDNFKGDRNMLSKIHSMLSTVNLERSDNKPLEFVSEFEALKARINNYGQLEGAFLKKDDAVLVADTKTTVSSDTAFMHHVKEGYYNQTMPVSNIDANSSNCLDKFTILKEETDSEDSFQIVDLLENMCCLDVNEDHIMHEEESQDCDLQMEKEFHVIPTNVNQNVSTEACKNAKYAYEVSKRNITFDPEEEWKQVLEMNKKLADFKEMLKSQEEIKISVKGHDDVGKQREAIVNSNNYKQKFLLLKGADNWLCNLSSRNEERVMNYETNLTSPVELIQKAFKLYSTKDDIKNWLSHE